MSQELHDFTPAGTHGLSHDDILQLRRTVWQNGTIEQPEAEAILALNARYPDGGAEWTDFLVEALSVWLVDQQDPRGHVDEGQAEWLIARLGRDGACNPTELELLVRVTEKAVSAPERLRDFALAQIERAAIAGTPCVTASEAKLLRRLLFAAAGERSAGVSQAEAELLFRIKDASVGAANAPEWQQLFVQGVGNFLQATTPAEPLSRERARELERFMNTPGSGGLGGFLGRMSHVHANGLVSAGRDVLGFGRKQPARDWDGEFERAAAIDNGEQLWLDRKVQADGQVDEYEAALLAFLKEA